MASTDLVNQCFKNCAWIPQTMVMSLLLNSSLLKVRIPALAFNSSYASSKIDRSLNPLTVCGIRLNLRIPLTNCADSFYNCGFHLHFVESTSTAEFRTTSFIRLLRKPQRNKCADKIYVTGI